jgi:hypothetical protein
MPTDRTMNNFFPGMRNSQLNLSNITSKNATFRNAVIQNNLETGGDSLFRSSVSVNDNLNTIVGDITSAGFVHANTSLSSGVVPVTLFNTGGGAVEYNPLNSVADIFIDSSKGNIFTVTGPAGSSLASIYIYFNSDYEIPENSPSVDGSIMTVLFLNQTSRTVTVNISGSIVKRTSNTIVIPSGNRSNIVFAGHSNIISEISRSGAMAA